jgi:hypothetical protein
VGKVFNKIKVENEPVYQVYNLLKKLDHAGYKPYIESFCGSTWVVIN